ncbi:MAG: hypothetical protein ABJL49_05285 [Parasphingorhabdus sp.]|uniref:hypothetical protein n=1 Tax=Alphaproteobacteria TaxID=28211 RepID=UPI003263CF84
MKRIIIAVAIICALGVFLYWQGGKDTRQSARETTITREKDIGDAIKDSYAAPSWRDELHERNK